MGCSKGVCCKWTYIILSVFVFMLGFLAFAPMYMSSNTGTCDVGDSATCRCWSWDDTCDEEYDDTCAWADDGTCDDGTVYCTSWGTDCTDCGNCDEGDDDCISVQDQNDEQRCGETTGDAANWESTGPKVFLNIHGYGFKDCVEPDSPDDMNSWNLMCALSSAGGPDKVPKDQTWAFKHKGGKTCNQANADWGAYRTEDDADCDWAVEACECTSFVEDPGYGANDCTYGLHGCDAWDYTCYCDDVECGTSDDGTVLPADCDDCDYSHDGGSVLECKLTNRECVEWGSEEDDTASCEEGMEDYCPGTRVDYCTDKQEVYKTFYTAWALWATSEAVLGIAATLAILSIFTAKISCMKRCATKFFRIIIAFALLVGSTFASLAFAMFDLGGVQKWANLINENGNFETRVTLCSGQPGVMVENDTMDGVSHKACLKRTPTFYLYILLVVTLSWVAVIATFATVCCCNPEKKEDEENNEVP